MIQRYAIVLGNPHVKDKCPDSPENIKITTNEVCEESTQEESGKLLECYE